MSRSNPRSLGFLSVVAMVLSLQLGSGIFLLPTLLAPHGIWGIISWMIAGLGAMVLCHVFSALSNYHPMIGGPHIYIGQAFGKRWAFYAGWSYWVLGWLGSAPLLVLASHSVENLLELGKGGIFTQCFLLWAFMTCNTRGSELSGLGERIFAVLKMLPLIVLPLISIPFWDAKILMHPIETTPMASLSAASLLTFWGFTGLEAGTTVADCVQNPKKVIPAALFWGTLLAMTIYIMNTVSILSVIPREILQQTNNGYGALLDKVLGFGWGKIIDLTVFLVCIGSLNSWVLAGGQMLAGGAKSGLFPAFFAKVNRYQSPSLAIQTTTGCLLFSVIAMSNQTMSNQIHSVIELGIAIYIGIYLLSVGALIRLIQQNLVLCSRLLAFSIVTSIGFCLWIFTSLSIPIFVVSAAIPVIGLVIARVFRWPIY